MLFRSGNEQLAAIFAQIMAGLHARKFEAEHHKTQTRSLGIVARFRMVLSRNSCVATRGHALLDHACESLRFLHPAGILGALRRTFSGGVAALGVAEADRCGAGGPAV